MAKKKQKPLSKKVKQNEELDNWYGAQPFDNVLKITGIDLMDYHEADEMEDGDKQPDRDEAIDIAKDIWLEMSVEEKQGWRDKIGDSWC